MIGVGNSTMIGEPPASAGSLEELIRSLVVEEQLLRPDLTLSERESWIQRAAQVVRANMASGRFELARDYMSVDAVAAEHLIGYIRKVLSILQQEGNRVARLRAGDAEAWEPAMQRLERMAYKWFGPDGREEWALEQAREVASATCADLWEWLQVNEFPFDVTFDRWAARGLVNRLQGANRERRRHEEFVPESLDDSGTGRSDGPALGETLSDAKSEGWTERVADLEASAAHLEAMLSRLKSRDALVLRLWYIQGLTQEEVAAAVGETVSYTHVLRFRALNRLRRLFAQAPHGAGSKVGR